MTGYDLGGENSSHFYLDSISFSSGDHRLRLLGVKEEDSVGSVFKLLNRDSWSGWKKVYKSFSLGTNDDGSPTTSTGNNEKTTHY